MGFNKIVFMRCAPLSKLIFESVFIKELIEKGFEVEYIDTTHLHTRQSLVQDFNEFNNIIKIKSITEFKEYLKKQDINKTLFIELVRFDYKSVRLYLLLKKYDFKLGFFARYAAKSVKVKTSLKQKLNGVFVKLKNRIGLRLAYLLKALSLLKTYDYIFAGGNKALEFFFTGYFFKTERKHAKIIKVNANDYDRFLRLNFKDEKPTEKYIVFLDQYLPYHQDFIIRNKKSLAPESYYSGLNKKFLEIENIYKLKVVIAAHPKAHNYKKDSPFEGRKIVFDKTIELVANSILVLAHYSTSINFAILYNKPIIFLLNKNFEEELPVPAKMMYELSEILKSPISYFEETIDDKKVKVDDDLYQQYKYNYMTSPESEAQLTLDIFSDFLSQSN